MTLDGIYSGRLRSGIILLNPQWPELRISSHAGLSAKPAPRLARTDDDACGAIPSPQPITIYTGIRRMSWFSILF
jgi:hypothetical protein